MKTLGAPQLVAGAVLTLGLGVGIGWLLGHGKTDPSPESAGPTGEWIARVGDQTIGRADFEQEMARRAGSQPGLFREIEAKQLLLDDLIYQRALVERAEATGLTADPAIRRTIDQLLASQVLQRELRPRQEQVDVSDTQVKAWYESHSDEYAVGERRRLAMLRVSVPPDADDAAWAVAESEVQKALTKAKELPANVLHFGPVAEGFSDHTASRYRGGVIGWISEADADRSIYDKAVLAAGLGLSEDGEIAGPFRGTDGVYAVRLAGIEPARSRPLEELAGGIRQNLRQTQMAAVEESFRQELISTLAKEINESALAAAQAPGPEADRSIPVPPALSGEG